MTSAAKITQEEPVEVHGLSQGAGPMVNVILKAPGISQFIEPYRAYRDAPDIKSAIATLQASASGCPKVQPDGWMIECDGQHPVWITTATLRRGALKEPTKSGVNAGQLRDPSVDYNYKWEIASFGNGPTPKKISANGKTLIEAKMADSMASMLQKEFMSNDRTALMQAIAFGVTAEGNMLSVDTVVELTSKWGDLLNERALSRVSPASPPDLPVAELKGSPAQETPPDALLLPGRTPIPDGVFNIEDVKKVLAGKGISNEQISRVLKEGGYERGSDWLKEHVDDYPGLLAYIEKGLNEAW